MKEILLLKYGEMVLKGLNKNTFNFQLIARMKRLLKNVSGTFSYEYAQSTLCVRCSEDADVDAAFDAAMHLFGIASVCRGIECEKSMDAVYGALRENISRLIGDATTFKCISKRSDKKFPMASPEICASCGELILELMPSLKVDVNNPEVSVIIEIRDSAAFIHGAGVKGAGGLPTGTAGRGLLLLSGGIDSPVAGYMMAKRGMAIDALYFESPPYTGDAAREKVTSLAEKLSEYSGRVFLHCVSVTEMQEAAVKLCEEKLFTLLLRRFMMRVANVIADKINADCIITGESVGQVASQTVPSINVTNVIAKKPVFRPCCGLDKEEIVVRARQIGTFDISILPYEDCCTVFTPKHPNVNPTEEMLLAEEAKLDIDGLLERAVASDRHIRIN